MTGSLVDFFKSDTKERVRLLSNQTVASELSAYLGGAAFEELRKLTARMCWSARLTILLDGMR